ncbi:LysR family transcriptional regulator [Henriciella sp.]|uniref:LysR family transcriptional regulator n=1 Tax=Henriciella sp. TaxID=1968823 RepID=UPI0026236A74|nr:LysR family transcriptional regulator [Henriciella sp.]
MSIGFQTMSLRHVEVFHAVYQTGSVSGAARALHVSQPSISKVLRHAESRIGFTLFNVVKGRLAPTEEAHILFRQVKDVYERIEALHEATKNLRNGTGTRLRIAVLPSLGLEVVPRAVASFRADNPEVSFKLLTFHNDEILKSLYERNSEFALTHDAPHHPRLSSRKIGEGELVLLFRKSDLPAPPERISPDMLKDRELIHLSGSGTIGTLFSNSLTHDLAGEMAISVQTYYIAASLVRHGAGMAIVDEFTARASLAPDMDYRPLDAESTFEIFCVHLEDRPLSQSANNFLAELQKRFRDQKRT